MTPSMGTRTTWSAATGWPWHGRRSPKTSARTGQHALDDRFIAAIAVDTRKPIRHIQAPWPQLLADSGPEEMNLPRGSGVVNWSLASGVNARNTGGSTGL